MIRSVKDCWGTQQYYRIYAACMYRPTFEKFCAKVQAMKDNPHVFVLGYFCGEVPVGVAAVLEDGQSAEILGIAVDQPKRKTGIGRRLITHIQDRTGKTVVAETDDESVGFYRRCGFVCQRFSVTKGEESYDRYRCELK